MNADTPETLTKRAAIYDNKARSLIDQYGTGIRPGWVSEEIAIARDRAENCRAIAAQLQKEQGGAD